MQDLIFIALTLLCFGVAHAYVTGCARLKPKSANDLKNQPGKVE
jgi:hypothetical protein